MHSEGGMGQILQRRSLYSSTCTSVYITVQYVGNTALCSTRVRNCSVLGCFKKGELPDDSSFRPTPPSVVQFGP